MPNRHVHIFHWNADDARELALELRRTGFETSVAAGLVNHKVCSIDHTWSGRSFTLRRDRTRKRDEGI